MKLKLLFSTLILLLFINQISYCQSSASESGIAIQGIARDADYTARLNESLNLNFEFYYKQGVSNVTVVTINKAVTTDDFGVFSTIVDPGIENNVLFSNNLVYLKISEGSSIISDEKLKHVPYAISANNGVPTGSIMPFIGAVAPPGWALCDGSALPASATNLIAMIGANAPDLRGMFMRGAGTNGDVQYADNVGPVINEIQKDAIQSHTHDAGTLGTGTAGNHQHAYYINTGLGGTVNGRMADGKTDVNADTNGATQFAGNHTHDISGSTAETGDIETRPVNYGVNYIIKL